MSGCIVGWAHSKFGKHEGRDIESLIVEVTQAALADAGVSAADIGFEPGRKIHRWVRDRRADVAGIAVQNRAGMFLPIAELQTRTTSG